MTPDNARGVWWLHPGWLVTAMGTLIITASWFISDTAFRLNWHTPKYLDAGTLAVCCAAVAAFALGAFTGALSSGRETQCASLDDLPWTFLKRTFTFCFWCTVIGYVTWAGAAVARGASLSLVMGILHGEKGSSDLMKTTYLGTISGVTTLTQFGIAAVILGTLLGARNGWRSVRLRLGILLFLAVARAIFNSERLAIIELGIPAALVLIRMKVLDSRRLAGRFRALLPVAPVFGSVALLLLFAASEYLRSWTNFYAGGDQGFWTFATLRLVGYYVTALNNGAVLLRYVGVTGAPFFMFHFLWRFPGISDFMNGLYPNLPWSTGDDPYMTILDVHANPEFNNGSGYFMPALDVGFIGALIFWVIAGLICGLCYRLYTRKHIGGLLFYPALFTGIAEMPRILYWGEGRIVPVYVILAIIVIRCLTVTRRLALERARGVAAWAEAA